MSEQQSLNGDGTITIKTSSWNRVVRERDEAREVAAKWESSSDAMERAGAEQARRADENREWALRAERERDKAREECKEAQYESEQQSRLLGISAEREYALRGKIFELERKILQLEAK